MSKSVHYRQTTYEQRVVLFEEWERLGHAHGSVTMSCKKAHTSTHVFYNWVERYLEYGIEGLQFPISNAPKMPYERASKIKDTAAAVKKDHPTWGLKKIAAEIAFREKIPKPAAETVKRALILAGMWSFRVENSVREVRSKRSI